MSPASHRALPVPSWLLAGLLALGTACAADGPDSTQALPLGAFNFTLESRSPVEQIAFLEGLGYDGMALFWPGPEAFAEFTAAPAVREGRFRMRAVLLEFRFEPGWDRGAVDAMLRALAPNGTDLWLILMDPASPAAARVDAVRELTDLATARGVRVVVYPHFGTGVATVEEALSLIDAVGRPRLKASLHLCHELKAGNVDRLAEIITAAAPRLALASVNGASRDTRAEGWAQAIQPLDRGDLDVQNAYLLPLLRAGYSGPFLLHTFGIEPPPEEHYRRSYEAWRKMSRAVADTLAGG